MRKVRVSVPFSSPIEIPGEMWKIDLEGYLTVFNDGVATGTFRPDSWHWITCGDGSEDDG